MCLQILYDQSNKPANSCSGLASQARAAGRLCADQRCDIHVHRHQRHWTEGSGTSRRADRHPTGNEKFFQHDLQGDSGIIGDTAPFQFVSVQLARYSPQKICVFLQEIDVGQASGIKAMRMTHSGEDGWMLYIPSEVPFLRTHARTL